MKKLRYLALASLVVAAGCQRQDQRIPQSSQNAPGPTTEERGGAAVSGVNKDTTTTTTTTDVNKNNAGDQSAVGSSDSNAGASNAKAVTSSTSSSKSQKALSEQERRDREGSVKKSKKRRQEVKKDETSQLENQTDDQIAEEDSVLDQDNTVAEQDNAGLGNVSQQDKDQMFCPSSPHAHASMLRSDLEYSFYGVDCQGDKPNERTVGLIDDRNRDRLPASSRSCPNDPHAHPVGMRNDIGYDLTGLDCQGDEPGHAFDFYKKSKTE